VFRKLYPTLKDGIQSDLDAFAVDLYSQELITKGTRDSATNHEVSSERRAITLLNAIEEKIMISGSVFWEFLEILEVYRKNLATELREEFEKFKNKPEQCDGVSEDPDLSVPIEPAQERKEASSSYVPSITVSNGNALTRQCTPQPDTSLHRDFTEQVPLCETGATSMLFVGSVGVKPLPAQLGESDGDEESTRIMKFTGAVAAAVRECAYVYVSEVQGDNHKRRTKMKQEYAEMDEYYKQKLERTNQKCNELERELELTRKELEQCKSAHQKETEHLESQIESRKKQLLYMVRQCTGQNRPLREKDSELEEMKQKLGKKDDLLHRMEADLNEMKVRLQEKEMEPPTS